MRISNAKPKERIFVKTAKFILFMLNI